jgi:hypothetical protein
VVEPTDLELEMVLLQAEVHLIIETKCDVANKWTRMCNSIDWTQIGTDEFGEWILDHYADEFIECSYRVAIAPVCDDQKCDICYDI